MATETKTGTVEAFESRFGAPIVGTQWHPESFLPGMKGSGEKYATKGMISFSQEIFRVITLAAVTAKLRRCSVVPSLRDQLQSGKLKLKHVDTTVTKEIAVIVD
jgi:putative glutamine amidotransferase